MTIQQIEKEIVASLHFPKEDVLFASEDIEKRNKNLSMAMELGNLDHQKITILFQDIEGIKKVETTIWGLTDTEIILKKGVTIPINRINHIKFL